jgi:hypothetical protein
VFGGIYWRGENFLRSDGFFGSTLKLQGSTLNPFWYYYSPTATIPALCLTRYVDSRCATVKA